MDIKQVLGIVGSVLIFIGAFSPVETLPLLGNNSYLGALNISGVLMLILAAASLLLSLLSKFRFLWCTGVGALALTIITFFHLLKEHAHSLEGMQWGWTLLVIGAGLIIAVAIQEEISRRQ